MLLKLSASVSISSPLPKEKRTEKSPPATCSVARHMSRIGSVIFRDRWADTRRLPAVNIATPTASSMTVVCMRSSISLRVFSIATVSR